MAVPAEELIEVEFREELRKKGIIKYFGGKVEFLYRGYLNDVDMAFMIHSGDVGEHAGSIIKGGNGCMAKTVTFHGKSSHAGGAPHNGINALYACNQALSAVNALRETFKDSDCVRFHPIITNGGTVVNAIPETVTLETYVRGATMESILENNEKINRAIAASAAALGAKVTISDRPGYSPRVQPMSMMLAMREAMEAVLETVKWNPEGWGKGSTDMGDISMVMPAMHPSLGGVSGTGHGADYRISHPETACVDMAKVMLSMLDLLLRDGAKRATEILAEFVPVFPSIEAFFEAVDKLDMDKDAVIYNEDGTVTLDYKK
jgi:metal-dependent amidase/aminoacylase/carboxypeptidase family protein